MVQLRLHVSVAACSQSNPRLFQVDGSQIRHWRARRAVAHVAIRLIPGSLRSPPHLRLYEHQEQMHNMCLLSFSLKYSQWMSDPGGYRDLAENMIEFSRHAFFYDT